VDDVGPESVDAPVEPEPQDVVHGGHHRRLTPVQVGLLGQEQVEVLLAGPLVERPRRSGAEGGHPVVGRFTRRSDRPPDVPRALRVAGRGAGLLEPRVAVGGVVGHPVDQDAKAEPVRLGEQVVEVVEGAEQGIDVAVVGDVVAEVGHGRAVERRQPDGVDAEVDQVAQPSPDAGEVADPVAVGVGERAGVDLVDHGVLPPWRHVRQPSEDMERHEASRRGPT
jgi:hypothetical protein